MTKTTNPKKKNPALGRGLSALLGDSVEIETALGSLGTSVDGISLIPINAIEANPFQPRTNFRPEELEELAASIGIHGVIQPITVRKMGRNNYQLISGERRTRAAMMSGLTQIPAYVRTANDQGMLEMALIENIQRSDLNAIEIALSYQRLLEECDLKPEELGERVGKNRSTVTNYLRLLKLPDTIQLGIIQGEISMGHARAIINAGSEEQQVEIFNQVIENNLSVRDVEALVKNNKISSTNGTSANPSNGAYTPGGTTWDPEIDRITEEFHRRLKAPVHLKTGKKGGGTVVISYKSVEDLQRILNLLNEAE